MRFSAHQCEEQQFWLDGRHRAATINIGGVAFLGRAPAPRPPGDLGRGSGPGAQGLDPGPGPGLGARDPGPGPDRGPWAQGPGPGPGRGDRARAEVSGPKARSRARARGPGAYGPGPRARDGGPGPKARGPGPGTPGPRNSRMLEFPNNYISAVAQRNSRNSAAECYIPNVTCHMGSSHSH